MDPARKSDPTAIPSDSYHGGMFKPDPRTIAALRDSIAQLAEPAASCLARELDAVLMASVPDLTEVLLRAVDATAAAGLLPGRALTASACRAAAKRIRERHPGGSIELRIPPFSAVQLGFGDGPKHTRGIPPNVVELDAETFLALATGRLAWGSARVSASGVHADQVAAVFPVTR